MIINNPDSKQIQRLNENIKDPNSPNSPKTKFLELIINKPES